MIFGARLLLKRRHDNINFKPLLHKTKQRIQFSTVVADKRYDSEDNLQFVEDKLQATPIIPPKYQDKPPDKTRGKRRQKLKQEFPQQKYNQRNKIETIISVLKQCYGNTIKAHTHHTKKNEQHLKFIAYNCRRIQQKIETRLKGFLQSLSIVKSMQKMRGNKRIILHANFKAYQLPDSYEEYIKAFKGLDNNFVIYMSPPYTDIYKVKHLLCGKS